MYYAIIIILFIILYGLFIYSLLSMAKEADLLAEKLYKEMRKGKDVGNTENL